MDIQEDADLYEKIAKESGITLYRRFTEQEASAMLDISVQTLRRIRDKGDIAHLRVSDRHVRFFGFQLCEYLVSKIEDKSCLDTSPNATKLGHTGSQNKVEAPHGAELGIVQKPTKRAEFRSAQRILQRRGQN